ncbi:MAG: hypothetical protein CMJ48_08620 [Planctomycetaceae bacterium]|nr:hypothetical protein [Planctomycetaceae bacterium]
MSSADVQAFVEGLSSEGEPPDGEQLARTLVRQQKLTKYQAQQVYAGKGKSLVLGNYVVLEKLGQGGMGLVLKAEHKRMKRTVALKILSPAVTKSPEMVRRFLREVEAAAKLEHTNVVAAYDADDAGGTHFLVMQYVEGTDLSVLVRQNGPLSVEKALPCVIQAARGLEYAHACGVVHRDIKPSNMLLDLNGTVKILDMGLARLDSAGAEQDQLTGTGQIMGTVDYMAPEQAMDTKTADGRADIYSLGVTLWYLLTGRPVYGAETVVKKLMAHQNSPIPSLRNACPGVSTELEAVFAKMIAKTPEARYQSMTEVLAALEGYTSGSASPPSIATVHQDDSEFNRAVYKYAEPVTEIATVHQDDSEFNAFLRGLDASPEPSVATKPSTTKKTAPSSEPQPTVTLRAEQLDTDPETLQSLDDAAGFRAVAGGVVAGGVVAGLEDGAVAGLPTEPPDLTAGLPDLSRPAPSASRRSGPPWWQNRTTWIASGTSAVLLLAIVIFVQTKDGTIRIEINDPEIEVAIKGTTITLKQADQGKDIELSPGEKTLIVKRGDFQFETDTLILKEGETVRIRVDLLADRIEARHGPKLIGRKKLP